MLFFIFYYIFHLEKLINNIDNNLIKNMSRKLKLPHDIIKLLFDNYVDARTKYRMSLMSKRYYNRKNMYMITLAAMRQKTNDECRNLYESIYVCCTCNAILKNKRRYEKHMQKTHKAGKMSVEDHVMDKANIVVACDFCRQNKITNMNHKCWSLTIPCRKQNVMNNYHMAMIVYDIKCPRDPDFYYSPARHDCLAICKACDRNVLARHSIGFAFHHFAICGSIHNLPKEYASSTIKDIYPPNFQFSTEGVEKFENDYKRRCELKNPKTT